MPLVHTMISQTYLGPLLHLNDQITSRGNRESLGQTRASGIAVSGLLFPKLREEEI